MPIHRYTLPGLRRHTRSVRAESAPIAEHQRDQLDTAVRGFDEFFAHLDEQSDNLRKNVRKVLATSFFNHWYSALLLIESGLIVDAVLCERNALETLAFHWLVCLDPAAVDDYHAGNIPKPVVVRRRLEALGVDIVHIREGYAMGSDISHVGRSSERFHVDWQTEGSGQLMIGGSFRREVVEHWLTYLPALLHLFPEPTLLGPTSEPRGV